MKNLKNLFLILIVGILSVVASCKKESAAESPNSLGADHKILFKVSTNTDSYINTPSYVDGAGGKKTYVVQGGITAWSSDELTMSSTLKTITFTSTSTAEIGKTKPFLTVEIWVDGVKKTEKTTTADYGGLILTATTIYTF